MSIFSTKLVLLFLFPSYFLCLFDLRLDFVIWLNETDFSLDGSYCIDDFKRIMHHRIVKPKVQESLKSQESADAIFMIIGSLHVM